MPRLNHLLIAVATIAASTVSSLTPSSGVVKAEAAPNSPVPVCVDGGLGCVDGPLTATVDGVFAAGQSFTITTNGAGLAPCADYLARGCYYDLERPRSIRCVFVPESDSTKVLPCGPLSTSGHAGASAVGSCRGSLGNTFMVGGPLFDPEQHWTARARRVAECQHDVGDTEINNLFGATFMLFQATVDECIPSDLGRCGDIPSLKIPRHEYVWVPVAGELAELQLTAECSAYQSSGSPERAIFRSVSVGTTGAGAPDVEWLLSDGTTSTSSSVFTEVDAPGSVSATITARQNGRVDTATCDVDMEAPELTAELEFERDEGADDEHMPLGEEFDLVLDLSTTPGVGDIDIDIDDLDDIFDDATNLTVVDEPTIDLPIVMESNSTQKFTWRLTGDELGDFEASLSVESVDANGIGQLDHNLFDDGTVVSPLTVNSLTGSVADSNLGDGVCDTGRTVFVEGENVAECSLRAAIEEANEMDIALDGERVIAFDIPGAGMPTIAVTSQLPRLNGPAVIDGSSQGNWVHIANRGVVLNGLEFGGEAVEVNGLVVTEFENYGMWLDDGGSHVIDSSSIGVLPLNGSADVGNEVAGLYVTSPANVIGVDAGFFGNSFAHNGEIVESALPPPGSTQAEVADALPRSGHVVFGPLGGGAVTNNRFRDGLGVVLQAEAGSSVAISGNDFSGQAGVLNDKDSGRVTISGNDFEVAPPPPGTESDAVGVAVVGRSLTLLADNEFSGLGMGIVAVDQTKLSIFDNDVDAGIGATLMGGSRTQVSGNEFSGGAGLFMLGDEGSETLRSITRNEFSADVGLLDSGGRSDTIEGNEFSSRTAALLIATADTEFIGNEIENDNLGVALVSPLAPEFGDNTVSGNTFDSDIGVWVMEERATIVDNAVVDADFGIFASPAAGSVFRGNTIEESRFAMTLLDVSGSVFDANTITESALGVLVASSKDGVETTGLDGADEETLWEAITGNRPELFASWMDDSDLLLNLDPSLVYRESNDGLANTWTSNTIADNGLGIVFTGDLLGTSFGNGDPAAGNVVVRNRQGGVMLEGTARGNPNDITIRGNSIFGNGLNPTPGSDVFEVLGGRVPDVVFLPPGNAQLQALTQIGVPLNDALDGDDGPNGLQNHPIVTNVTDAGTISGELFSMPNSGYAIDFYANDGGCNPTGYGGGQRLLGTTDVTTNASGQAPFSFDSTLASGQTVTAMATSTGLVDGASSQLSYCLGVGEPATVTIVASGAGETRLQVSDQEDFEIGDFVIINPGQPNEESGTVDGFGSIILEEPLQFDHGPGELIVVTENPPEPKPEPDPDPPPLDASSLNPVTPARVLETRDGESTIDGLFEGEGRLAAGSVTPIRIAGRGGVDADASAVAVNVTAVRPSGGGYVTLFPCDAGQPTTSSLNHGVGGVAGNSGVVKLSVDGAVCVFAFAETDLIIDVTGWVAASTDFVSIVPARLAETRSGEETSDGEANELGRLGAGSTTKVKLAGRGGVSADADAVALNVTAIRPAGVGYVTLFPCGGEQPLTSSLNFAAGDVKGNSAVVSLSAAGELCVFTSAETDLVLDVNASLRSNGSFGALVPGRVLDTRADGETVDGVSQAGGNVRSGEVVEVDVAGRANVPDGAAAVAVNVTAVRPDAVGYVTLFPCDGDQPVTSSLNYSAGGVAGNSAIVKLADDGSLCAFSFADTELIIDITASWTG